MDLARARAIADTIAARLHGLVFEYQVCGSIRRRKPDVKDIEIVARPRPLPPAVNLFGEPVGTDRTYLDLAVDEALRAGRWAHHPTRKALGPKYKRLWLVHEGIALDLFLADEHNYGNLIAIRTGDSDFSRALVTSRLAGGLMPAGMRQEGGYLWQSQTRLSCPTEESFFDALGLATRFVPYPPERTAETARSLPRRTP